MEHRRRPEPARPRSSGARRIVFVRSPRACSASGPALSRRIAVWRASPLWPPCAAGRRDGRRRHGVSVRGTDILLDGKPFVPNGSSGTEPARPAQGTGANVIRTYGEEPGEILDAAQRAGLKVIVGFWMEHRAGASITPIAPPWRRSSPTSRRWWSAIAPIRPCSCGASAMRWRPSSRRQGGGRLARHRAGGEAREGAGPGPSGDVVVADTGGEKVAALKRAAPSVDVLGINAYGDSL